MELKQLIERAEQTAGSQKALSEYIGQTEGNIRGAKSGARGLPTYACVLIADLIGEDQITVIAASELVTEKKETRRKIWRPFVRGAAGAILTNVILNMSPTPSEAAPILAKSLITLYIMSNCRKLKQLLLQTNQMSIPKTLLRLFIGRVHHMPA